MEKFIDGTKKLQRTPMTFVTTHEGKAAVHEALDFVRARVKAGSVVDYLTWSDECHNIAKKHTGFTLSSFKKKESSKSKDGSEVGLDLELISPAAHSEFTRLFKEEFQGDEEISGHAECHDFGSLDPTEVVLSLVIDDGNSTRSNRATLFGNWDYIGVSSLELKEYPQYKRLTSLMFVLSMETVDRELEYARQLAEEKLEIGNKDKHDWLKKGTSVKMDKKGVITVTFKLELRNGKEEVLHYEYQSKY